jgi:hypothetical protein
MGQILHDPDADQLREFLAAWHKEFGDKPSQVRQVLRDRYSGELWDAIMELPVVDNGKINPSKFGRYLRRNSNRIVGGLKLEQVPNSERTAWRVVRVTPPSPPLPPSTGPAPATDEGLPEDEY